MDDAYKVLELERINRDLTRKWKSAFLRSKALEGQLRGKRYSLLEPEEWSVQAANKGWLCYYDEELHRYCAFHTSPLIFIWASDYDDFRTKCRDKMSCRTCYHERTNLNVRHKMCICACTCKYDCVGYEEGVGDCTCPCH